MSTRANVEFYTYYEDAKSTGKKPYKGALLYHHSDGYPEWMGGRLIKALEDAKNQLAQAGHSYWWDSERVSAIIVAQDANSSEYRKGVPAFQPCSELHGDIEYLWRIYLGPTDGAYEIKCFKVEMDWNAKIKSLTEVKTWKSLAKKGGSFPEVFKKSS